MGKIFHERNFLIKFHFSLFFSLKIFFPSFFCNFFQMNKIIKIEIIEFLSMN